MHCLHEKLQTSVAKKALFYIEYQTFKVFALRMIDAYGMVGGLGELMQYAHATPRHGCCGKHCRTEVVLRYYL